MQTNLRQHYKSVYINYISNKMHNFTPSGKIAGAILAVSSIKEAVPLIHGSSGCLFHYKCACRRGNFPVDYLQSSELEECNIVFGSEQKLKDSIFRALDLYKPKIIVIIPSNTIDMIDDDIGVKNVIEYFVDKTSCKFIYVKSEKFSHADKRGRDRYFYNSHDNLDSIFPDTDEDLKSCGFSEVMKALVEQVMLPCEKKRSSINICEVGWAESQKVLIDGMIKDLNRLNITVNTRMRYCSYDEIENAPAAEMNLVNRRTNWAVKMKQLFETEYYKIEYFNCYRTPNELENIYLCILDKITEPSSARNLLSQWKANLNCTIDVLKEKFKDYKALFYCYSVRDLSGILSFYKSVLGLEPEAVIIKQGNNCEVQQNIEKYIVLNIPGLALSKVFIAPTEKKEVELCEKIDFIIGVAKGKFFNCHIRAISPPKVLPIDFEGYEKAIKQYAEDILNNNHSKVKITDKLERDALYYDKDENVENSLDMWNKMWEERYK